MTTWTEERKNIVKEFWLAGYTASQICAALGHPYTSRNSIISLVHRAGMSRANGERRSKLRSLKRIANPFGSKKIGAEPLERPPPSPVIPNKVDIPKPRSRKLTLQKLTSYDCRWPEGDGPFFFCGIRKKEGSVYCEHHHRRAYNNDPKQRSAA